MRVSVLGGLMMISAAMYQTSPCPVFSFESGQIPPPNTKNDSAASRKRAATKRRNKKKRSRK